MSITINRWTRRDLIALVAILLVAAALRIAKIDVTDYHLDQARLIGMAQNLIAGKFIPTEGLPASVGFPQPPTLVYLVALPYLISSNPLFTEFCIVMLNLIGVTLLYRIAQRYFNSRIALIASLAYACNPWAIQFSRGIWPPQILTPFALAAIFCALLGFVEQRRWAQVLSLPLMTLAISIYYAAGALTTIFIWFFWRKRASWRAIALSMVISLILLLPFFANFAGSRLNAIRTAISQPRDGGWAVTPAIAVAARFASGAGVERIFGIASADYTNRFPPVFWIFAAIPVVIGLIFVRSHPLAPVLYLWTFSATILLTILPIFTYEHYLVTCIPAFCLLAGIGLNALVARLHPIVVLPWLTVMVLECLLWFNLLGIVRNTSTHDFGPPLADLLPVRQQLLTAQDVIIVGGVTGVSGSDVWSSLLFRTATCVRELIIADGGIHVLPAHPFTMLIAPGADMPDTPYIPSNTIQIPLQSSQNAYTIDNFDDTLAWNEPKLTSIQPARFDNGVVLKGYSLSAQRLYLDWMLPASGLRDYQYFVHVLDARGEKVAQHDASFWPSKYWCDGDRIITWTDLARPADATILRIGLYSLSSGTITGSNVIDSENGALSPWLDIPLGSSIP